MIAARIHEGVDENELVHERWVSCGERERDTGSHSVTADMNAAEAECRDEIEERLGEGVVAVGVALRIGLLARPEARKIRGDDAELAREAHRRRGPHLTARGEVVDEEYRRPGARLDEADACTARGDVLHDEHGRRG